MVGADYYCRVVRRYLQGEVGEVLFVRLPDVVGADYYCRVVRRYLQGEAGEVLFVPLQGVEGADCCCRVVRRHLQDVVPFVRLQGVVDVGYCFFVHHLLGVDLFDRHPGVVGVGHYCADCYYRLYLRVDRGFVGHLYQIRVADRPGRRVQQQQQPYRHGLFSSSSFSFYVVRAAVGSRYPRFRNLALPLPLPQKVVPLPGYHRGWPEFRRF